MLCSANVSGDMLLQVVEKVATCLISIVESFSGSVDLLDQLGHQGVVEKNLIGLLAKLSCSSLVAVKALFELNVGSTIRGILVSSDLSHGMPPAFRKPK